MAVEAPKKTKNGTTFSVVFRPEQMVRLNALIDATGLNRNQLFRLCAEKLTPSDIKLLRDRD